MSSSKEKVQDLLTKHEDQLVIGREVEKEHKRTIDKIKDLVRSGTDIDDIDNEEIYQDIAIDHLEEFDDYYDRLEDMEEEAEKEQEQKEEGVV